MPPTSEEQQDSPHFPFRTLREAQFSVVTGASLLKSPYDYLDPLFHCAHGETEAQRGNDRPSSAGEAIICFYSYRESDRLFVHSFLYSCIHLSHTFVKQDGPRSLR